MKHNGLTAKTGWALFLRYFKKNALSFGITLLILALTAAGFLLIFRFIPSLGGRTILALLLMIAFFFLIMSRIKRTQTYFEFRREFANQSSDQKLLAELAVRDRDSIVRENAAERIVEPALIEQILLESQDKEILFALLRSAKKIVQEQKKSIPPETSRSLRDFALQQDLLSRMVCDQCFSRVQVRKSSHHAVEYEYSSSDTVVIGDESDVTDTAYYCSNCGKDSGKDFSVPLESVLPKEILE